MSSNNTESKKRPAGTPESAATEKPEPKRTKSYNPRDEAIAVSKRKPMPAGTSKPEAAATPGASQADLGEGADEVFNPQDKTVGEESLDVSDDAQLFELALATNLEEAMDLAETPQQKARVFAAIKKREASSPAKVENGSLNYAHIDTETVWTHTFYIMAIRLLIHC